MSAANQNTAKKRRPIHMTKSPAVKIEIEAVTDKKIHIKYTGENCERSTAYANLHFDKTSTGARELCRREGADTISVNLMHRVGIQHLEGSYLITTWNEDIPLLEQICRFPGIESKHKGRGITTLAFADTFEYREWYQPIFNQMMPRAQISGGTIARQPSKSSHRKRLANASGKGNDVGNASQGNNHPGYAGQATTSIAPPFYRRLFQAFKGRGSIYQENIRTDVESATTSSSEQNDCWYDAVTDQ